MREKLEKLANLIKEQNIKRLEKLSLNCEVNIKNCETHIKEGNKYTKIDIGTSGKLMIENSTGIIYGIKGYGQVHKGHSYGTLDTIEEYYWGEYYPQKKV